MSKFKTTKKIDNLSDICAYLNKVLADRRLPIDTDDIREFLINNDIASVNIVNPDGDIVLGMKDGEMLAIRYRPEFVVYDAPVVDDDPIDEYSEDDEAEENEEAEDNNDANGEYDDLSDIIEPDDDELPPIDAEDTRNLSNDDIMEMTGRDTGLRNGGFVGCFDEENQNW